jgi:aminoglycoside phosphotransferase (APT) family kinase protein
MGEQLDKAIVDWIGGLVGGEVTGVERSQARREGWYVDATPHGGGGRRYFLRLGREGDPANDPRATTLEAEINRVLGRAGVRVATVFGTHPSAHAVLYERVAGRSDLERVDPAQQQAVYRDYLTQLAHLHRLDPGTIALEGLRRPASAEDCALVELARVEADFAPLICEPLATFGVQWLRRHVPRKIERISFVHGDAGTPNFMFEGERVTALIDWEWAHFGDPMEDLGNAVIHASFHPSGDWPELLEWYAKVSGIPVDLERVSYYRAHLMVRSVLALAAATARWDPHTPVALNLCYRVVSDRICCDAIAAAMGIELERPDLPFVPDAPTTLYDVVAENLVTDVRPEVVGGFPAARLDAATLLVLSLEREHRIGPALAEVELDELAMLLGRRPQDLVSGIAELDRALAGWGPEREVEVLRYLGRRAWRTEQLLKPVVSLFADRELRPLVRARPGS